MRLRKTAVIAVAAIIVLAFALFSFGPFGGEKASYQEFLLLLEDNKVDGITITGTTMKVKADGKTLSVPNPDYPTFQREMMERGIEVRKDDTTLDDALNTLFDIIFFAIVIFLLYKALSWYSTTFRTVRHTGVHFSDIAGMEEVKNDMARVIGELKGNGKRNVKGIVLEGPPGNGKTLFARALAEESGVDFIATKGADFQGAVMGLGAMKVKMLFSKARKKKPCIIFIDEFDSIGEKRNYAGSGIDKENNRILTTLLNEMDGFTTQSGILVVAATNSFQSLDPALVRPGRFDLKYTITNPNQKTRMELVEMEGRNMKFSPDLTPQVLSTIFDGLSSAAIVSILSEARSIADVNGRDSVTIECIIASAAKCREKLNIRIKKN
ncbi:MAG: ATP-binding protein [Candidatus Ornithospirochaeta sp.]